MKKRFALIFLVLCSGTLSAQSGDVVMYSWEDVQGSSPDTVYGIDFSRNKLTEVPHELASFKKLRYLNLGKNKLDSLPAFLGELMYLEELNVEKNKLVDLPRELCRLASLKRLIINRNGIEALPACTGTLTSLEYLDVYDNPIRSLPESITRLENLEKIDFSGIQFSATFQQKWRGLLPGVELIFDNPCDCME